MSLEIKHHLTTLLTQALQQVAPNEPASLILLERPKQAEHGDYACNVAMQLARSLKRKPRELADGQIVVNHHGKPEVLVATASTWDIDGTLKTYIVDVRLAGVSLSW